MDAAKGALRWWREARRRRPVLFGGIFWAVFWSVSAATMMWVYSPGGLGDPDRDLRTPKRGIGAPICIKDCPAETETVAAPEETTAATAGRTRRKGSSEPTTEPTTKIPITLPPVPTVELPDVSIVIDEVLTLAGNRYLHYRIDVTAKERVGDVIVTANVPKQGWFSECSGQGEQRVCVDSFRGSGDTHQVEWSREIEERSYAFTFWVHVDPTTEVGEEIHNHAHVKIDESVVTSKTNVFVTPSILG